MAMSNWGQVVICVGFTRQTQIYKKRIPLIRKYKQSSKMFPSDVLWKNYTQYMHILC